MDAGDVGLGDVGDVLGPGLPVAALADLAHDPGVHRVAEALEAVVERQLLLGPRFPVRAFAVDVDVVLCRWTRGDVDDVEPWGLALVELDAVDHRVETVVVGPQRLQHLPHDLVALVVVERL